LTPLSSTLFIVHAYGNAHYYENPGTYKIQMGVIVTLQIHCNEGASQPISSWC